MVLSNEISKNTLEIDELTHQVIPSPQEMNELETKVEQLEAELQLINNNDSILKTRYIELMELKQQLPTTPSAPGLTQHYTVAL